jgi:hypothetical protein
MLRHARRLAVIALGAILLTTTAPASIARAEDAAAAARKEEARVHFERGRELVQERAWDAALAEFLRSRQLFPTRGNTQNAAVCLRQLRRFDEALDMLEALFTFPNIPPEDRDAAEKAMVAVRALVGSIDVRVSVPGAVVRIDERDRGASPFGRPLRVSSGSHVVRVFKEGFRAFETRVDVAGGESVTVDAPLAALTQSGRLKVTETEGRALDVVVDTIVVGKTPWEGPLSPGAHTVLLRGDARLGTQPATVPIRVDDVTTIALHADTLDCELRIEPVPLGATIAVDGVAVGRGLWEGRVREGGHRVEAAAEGFLPERRVLLLASGQREAIHLTLERDPSSALWRSQRPSRVVVDLRGSFAFARSLGGDLASSCKGSCDAGLPIGFHGALEGGYELGSGFGMALDVGYLYLSQTLRDRAIGVTPVGRAEVSGTAEDRLTLRGLTVGVAASIHRGERFPFTARLGAGALIGSLSDRREATFPDVPGGAVAIGPSGEAPAARYAYVAPELRLGVRLGDRIELSAALEALVLVAITSPRWQDSAGGFALGNLGLAKYGNQTLTSSLVLVFTPGVGVRFAF